MITSLIKHITSLTILIGAGGGVKGALDEIITNTPYIVEF